MKNLLSAFMFVKQVFILIEKDSFVATKENQERTRSSRKIKTLILRGDSKVAKSIFGELALSLFHWRVQNSSSNCTLSCDN